MPMPLEGIKVVDLSQVWAMPGGAMYLADQGADVVKIEPLWGDEARRLNTTAFLGDEAFGYLVMNRNKRGIAVDITKDRGREIAYKLLRGADVTLLNFRPGVAERIGFGYETLRQLNPRLVYASTTPWGEKGEWSQRRGYDLLFQGLSGQLGRTRSADGTPSTGGKWTVDAAGSMGLAFGIMTALYRRERTGLGQRVDSTMLGTSLAIQSVGLVKAYDDPGMGMHVPPLTSDLFRCSDGGWLVMIIVRQEHFFSLCDALGVDHLSTPEGYRRSRTDRQFQEDLSQLMQGVFETRPRDEWLALLMEKDFPVAPVLSPGEAVEHPQMLANGMFVDIRHPTRGRLRMPAPHIRLSEGAPSVRSPAPTLGQHTDQALSELGYTPVEVAALRAEKVVS